jgi:hypothetical protein
MAYVLKCPFCNHQKEIPKQELMSGKMKPTPAVLQMLYHVRSTHDYNYEHPHFPILQVREIGMWEILNYKDS